MKTIVDYILEKKHDIVLTLPKNVYNLEGLKTGTGKEIIKEICDSAKHWEKHNHVLIEQTELEKFFNNDLDTKFVYSGYRLGTFDSFDLYNEIGKLFGMPDQSRVDIEHEDYEYLKKYVDLNKADDVKQDKDVQMCKFVTKNDKSLYFVFANEIEYICVEE